MASATPSRRAALLDLRPYIDAVSSAATRIRLVTIVLVTTSVVLCIGWLNSINSAWMLGRIRNMHRGTEYATEKLGVPPQQHDMSQRDYYDLQLQALLEAFAKTYSDTSIMIRVPFFGIGFDANDFGMLGGTALVMILLWFRLSLARERDNLAIAFARAKEYGVVAPFYDLASTNQVLTIPKSRLHARHGIWAEIGVVCWRLIQKILLLFPLAVQILVLVYDHLSEKFAKVAPGTRLTVLRYFEYSAGIVILLLTIVCLIELARLDRLWDEKYQSVRDEVG